MAGSMYAKLINGTLRRAPKKVIHKGKQIFNPPDDLLLELGYLPVQYTDPPEDVPEGYYYESKWEQDDKVINQAWELVKEPEIEDLQTE